MSVPAGSHRNWGGVAADAAGGAATGAAIGSAFAGVGAVPGAVVGGAAGFLTGLLTSASPDDPPAPLAPPKPPDIEDEIARRGELAKQMRLQAQGPGSFLSGPLGDTSVVPGKAPAAGGY